MPRVPEMVWDDYRTGTSFGSDFARLLGGGLTGIGGIQRAEANREKDRALKAADDARAEDHFNRSLAQNDEHFRMSRADRFSLAAQKYDEGDDLFDVTDPSNPVPVPKGEHPVSYARSLGAAQMEDGGPAAPRATLPEWQATTDHSNQTAPRGSKTYFQATTPEQRALAAKYDASPLGQAEAKARAASESATPPDAPAEASSGRVIVKGKYLASILANRRGIDKEERVGETAAARAERLKRQEGEAETAGRVLTRAMSDPEYVPTPDEMEAVSKDPRGVSLFGNLSARIQKRKDAAERESALQAAYVSTWKALSDKVPPESLVPITDKEGRPLPAKVLEKEVTRLYREVSARQAQEFQKAMQEDRQAAAAELADYNAGKLDARTTATRSASRVSSAEARLAAAENQLRSTEVSEATAIAHSYDARGEALAKSSFAEARSQAAANVEAARRALDEARSMQVVLAPKGPPAAAGAPGGAPPAPTAAAGAGGDPRAAQAAWETANPTATFEEKRQHWLSIRGGG